MADIGLHATGAIGVASAVGFVLKNALGRARPYTVADANAYDFSSGRGLRRGSAYQSLPSCYTIAAFALASVVSIESRMRWPHAVRIVTPVVHGAATLVAPLFAKVGEDVFEHESGSFDDGVRTWMLHQRTPSLFVLFTRISTAGSVRPMLVLTALVVLWVWQNERRPAATGAIAAPGVAVVRSNGIKLAFTRTRPSGAQHFALHSFAFPSGDATISMAVAATIAHVCW